MWDKIESICKEKNISIYQLSKDTNIPKSCLYDYKKGRSKPKYDKLVSLAKYFDVPLEKLIE